jgi:PEP-CTERM motif
MTYTKQAAIQPTKKRGLWASLSLSSAAIVLMGLANPAAAHVSYTDLSDLATSPGGVNGGSFSNYGWHEGTTAALGDSHSLAGGTFFKFHLAQDSNVSIIFSDYLGNGLLNPAFSVYNGLFADEAHDDTPVDPLNPGHFVTTPTAHNVYTASPVDNGVATDWLGHVSPLRDTVNQRFNGQFDALHSWSMANEAGDWSVAEYITHVGPTGGNSVALLNYFMHAGDYTIAAAGGNVSNVLTNATGIDGTIAFSASPVPVPASIWLFGSAVAGFVASRRKRKA